MTDRLPSSVGELVELSAAHELAERGFNVIVYEANSRFGGKARSIPVNDTDDADHQLLGEHGFRFFPGFYQHVTGQWLGFHTVRSNGR